MSSFEDDKLINIRRLSTLIDVLLTKKQTISAN